MRQSAFNSSGYSETKEEEHTIDTREIDKLPRKLRRAALAQLKKVKKDKQ